MGTTPAQNPACFQPSRVAIAEGRFEAEYRRIREDDGRTVWMRSSGLLVCDDEGRPTRAVGVAQDIGDRRAEEDRRRALMAELDHRVKNVLAAVQALAVQTAKRTTSLDSFLSTFSGRLKSMASANELLTAARRVRTVLARTPRAVIAVVPPPRVRRVTGLAAIARKAHKAASAASAAAATAAAKV